MKFSMDSVHSFAILFLFLQVAACYAEDLPYRDKFASNNAPCPPFLDKNKGPVCERVQKENYLRPNFFAIAFYKPTYVLPYYYTGSPYRSVYINNTPNNENLNHSEMKYQLSFKVPLFKNAFKLPTILYLAYTQLSYWQAYNHTAFFRETDYEPELFLANELNIPISENWCLNLINLGLSHQSNGYGNELERSWNRLYLEMIASFNNWMISVKPWIVFNDATMLHHNPNITNYLGYGRLLIAYKCANQVFSLETHNFIEAGGKRFTAEFSWSFPITSYVHGYVQLFSGYGQSLIEYNHHTNSIGVGIALSNWV